MHELRARRHTQNCLWKFISVQFIQLPLTLTLSLEFISLQLEGIHLQRVSVQWKDAAKYTDEVVTLSYASGVSTLKYFQIARTVHPFPTTNTSWWRIYQDGPGLVRVMEIDDEDGMNARNFFD